MYEKYKVEQTFISQMHELCTKRYIDTRCFGLCLGVFNLVTRLISVLLYIIWLLLKKMNFIRQIFKMTPWPRQSFRSMKRKGWSWNHLFERHNISQYKKRLFTDFEWSCELQQLNGLALGENYSNTKGCQMFMKSTASFLRKQNILNFQSA